MAGRKRAGIGGKIAALGCFLGIAGASLAVGAGLGNRYGFWSYREGFAALNWIAWVGGAAAVISLIGIVMAWRRGRGALVLALVGLVLGSAVAWMPYHGQKTLRASARLPDVSTDTVNPPAFVAALDVRKRAKARNTTDYTPQKAEIQARAYPDIKPVIVRLSPDAAFDKALAAIRALGLELIAADKAAGRIEATDTTFWFGFKDDVAIRIVPAPEGAKVDIRSTSRVGARDGGTNAARVRNIARRIAAN